MERNFHWFAVCPVTPWHGGTTAVRKGLKHGRSVGVKYLHLGWFAGGISSVTIIIIFIVFFLGGGEGRGGVVEVRGGGERGRENTIVHKLHLWNCN